MFSKVLMLRMSFLNFKLFSFVGIFMIKKSETLYIMPNVQEKIVQCYFSSTCSFANLQKLFVLSFYICVLEFAFRFCPPFLEVWRFSLLGKFV